MNSSESPSSFEEKWTAYLDGKLTPADALAFERGHPEVVAERAMHSRLAGALRTHSPSPEMRNPDFFNESILREISSPPSPAPRQAAPLWSLWRLAAAGAFCILAAGVIYAVFVRGHEQRPDRYIAQVLSVQAGDAELSATVLDADGLAVVWIDGLEDLPSDYVLQ